MTATSARPVSASRGKMSSRRDLVCSSVTMPARQSMSVSWSLVLALALGAPARRAAESPLSLPLPHSPHGKTGWPFT